MRNISKEYFKLQKKLHDSENYGIASISHAPYVKKFFELGKLTSISDYGAGKKNLQKELIKLGLSNFSYYP